MKRRVAMACAALLQLAGVARAQPAKPAARPGAGPAPSATPVARVKPLGETLTGEAKKDYDDARLLIGDGDAAGAFLKLRSAYERSKEPRLLWNMAATQKSLRHYARTIALIRQYLAEGGDLLTPKDRQEAQDLITTIEPFTVSTTFKVSEEGAVLFVDDESVGTSPLAKPVLLDMGTRRVTAKKPGFVPHTGNVAVGGSAEAVVEIKLEREVHEGKLRIRAPAGAHIVLDGREVGTGSFEGALASGGHTLRITAPGMRVYEREVVVQDNEARDLDVLLEPEAEAAKARLRVAVGCGSNVPVGTRQGLVVRVDGSPTSASAVAEPTHQVSGRDVVEHVAYDLLPGRHVVVVHAPGCQDLAQSVDAVPGTGADLSGALRKTTPFLLRGPSGNPNWGRAGLALWLPMALPGTGVGPNIPEAAEGAVGDTRYLPAATGIMAHAGFSWRWWTILLNLGYASGSASFEKEPTLARARPLLDRPDVVWARAALRTGPRFSFHRVALSLGPGVGVDVVDLRTPPGIGWDPLSPTLSGWTMLDVQPLCDWTVFGAVSADYAPAIGGRGDGMGALSTQIGVAYQPNTRCRNERTTEFGLFARARKEKP